MRFAGETVRISSAEWPLRSHAYGLSTATAAKRDHSSLMWRWWSSTDRPACARSAVSNSGYTWIGIMISRARSSGRFMSRSSETSSGASSVVRHCGVTPAFVMRALVRVVSPPVRMMMSAWPARISREAEFTRVCGVLPPIADSPSWRGERPRSSATNFAGLP